MSGRQSAVICHWRNELLSRHPFGFAPAILRSPPWLCCLGRCHTGAAVQPSDLFAMEPTT